MQIILAFDNDTAGNNVVTRTLEKCIQDKDFEIPMPNPDDMELYPYILWLKTLKVSELYQELQRLKDKDNPDDLPKVEALLNAFLFCKKAMEYAKHRDKYLIALKEAKIL